VRQKRDRPVKRHKREEGGELYHGKPNELGAALVRFSQLHFEVCHGLHKRLDVARRGLRVLRKIWHLVVVDTNRKGSLENGEIDPGVAKVLGFRLERVLTTLVRYDSVRFRFLEFPTA